MLAKEIISIPQHTLPQNKSPFSKWRWGCFVINVFRGCCVVQKCAFCVISANYQILNSSLSHKCDVTHAANCPPPIFSITAIALRHLNKLRCIFCIQNIDFLFGLPNTHLTDSRRQSFMPSTCPFIHSQAVKKVNFSVVHSQEP